MKQFIAKRLKPLLFITVFVAAACSAVQNFGWLQRLEYIAYDWQLTLARQNKTPPDDIKIILVDDASLRAMDPIVGRWPWPRKVFAEVIDFIARGNPKAIIFDILFSENEKDTTGVTDGNDSRLVSATQNAGMVYHAMLFMNDEGQSGSVDLPSSVVRHNPAIPAGYLPTGHLPASTVNQPYNNFLIPIDGLYQSAAGLGVVTVDKDSDGVLRRMAPYFAYQGQYFPALSTVPLFQRNAPSETSTPLPLTEQGELLVNQYPFSSYSMSAVLAAKAKWENGDVANLPVDPEEFKDKYVFIGASAIGLQDLKTTPLIKNAPGVYMHASVLGNFLNNDFLLPPNSIATYLSIVLATLLTVIVVLISKRLLSQLVLPALILVAYGAVCVWQFQYNHVLVMVTPTLAILCAWACCYAFLLFTEEKEKNKIRKMFSQYVSPAALTAMVDNFENYAQAGKGSKETITVLFSDVRGFTELSESLPAEQVVEILNFYFSKMTDAVHKHNGTVDKFIGDAIMAIWGAPVRSETHALDAVNAALEMIQKLKEVNEWMTEKNYPPLKIGIGINTGEAILGSVGSEQKADYTVIGDTVNLASRLESVTKQYDCEIIISDTTKRALKDRVACQVVDLIKVKGKAQATKIYAPIVSEPETSRTQAFELHCLSELSHEAFSHYLNKRWDLAINAYRKIPNENLRKKFINRCEYFQASPPPLDWDGTTSMVSK